MRGQLPVPEKFCETCGIRMERKRYGKRLEDRGVFMRRRHCSMSCANTRQEPTSRDTLHWRARKHKAQSCAECATTDRLHVHHIDRNPANNDPTNLLTLCASCHLKLHWREDRDKRLAGARRGAATRQQSTDGKAS